jgi:two-component system sensor histidine kinase PilS (NtrC family)
MLRSAVVPAVPAFRHTNSVSRVNTDRDALREAALPDDLVRAAKAAVLGELTRDVAHELNNPLLAILGLVDLLVAEAAVDSRAQRRLAVVRETALEMRALIRALLEVARDSAPSQDAVDLAGTVRRALELVRRATSAQDVEVVERIAPEPLQVAADRGELAQAVLHLLVQAYAALPAGGTVIVVVERDGDRALVTVTDSGDAIGADVADRVFEPFFATERDRSGLGLAASRAIAEKHGGSLALRSSDRGASFVLTLPLGDDASNT